MPLWNIVDLIRAMAAFAAVYLVIPAAAMRFGSRKPVRLEEIPRAFLSAAFFVQVSVLILGDWRLCLPGAFGALYLVWAGLTAAFASRKRWLFDNLDTASGLLSMFRRLEAGKPATRAAASRWFAPRTLLAWCFSAALMASFALNAWFPVANVRFQSVETYGKTLSLQFLVHGSVWERDGGVALYAPVVFLSGLDASVVMRMLSPVVTLLLIAACSWCAYVFSRLPSAAYLGACLATIWVLVIGPDSVGEAGARELATAFWILAVAAMPQSFGQAACAGAVAALMGCAYPPNLPPLLILIAAAIVIAHIAAAFRAPSWLRGAATVAPVAAVAIICLSPMSQASPKGAHQYESAARMAGEIAANFRQNDWLIISPGAEIPQIYGRGWHAELSDFVSAYSIEQLSNPGFKLPYAPRNVFIFLEKRPLDQAARHIAFDSGKSAFYYSTFLGRSSMEFQAARLTVAYAREHKNASVYYQDDDIIDYRIQPASK